MLLMETLFDLLVRPIEWPMSDMTNDPVWGIQLLKTLEWTQIRDSASLCILYF